MIGRPNVARAVGARRCRHLLAILASAIAAAVIAAGCRAVDCTETATCAGSADAGACEPGRMEDCTNGVDDNCDGLVDCADPQCQPGYRCAPEAPAGFQGPVVLYDESGGPPAPSVPPCEAPYPSDQLDGYDAPSFQASSCACQCGSVDRGCIGPAIRTFTDNTCRNSCNLASAIEGCASDACTQPVQSAMIVTPPAVSAAGSCSASAQATFPAWDAARDWGRSGRACGTGRSLLRGGCSTAQVCTPRPPSTLAPGLCVFESGDASCPATYPGKHTYFAGGSDSRSCTGGCRCDPPTGVTCTLISAAISSSCPGGSGISTMTGLEDGGSPKCSAFSSTPTPFASATLAPSGGSCAPAGTTGPTGTVAPTTPTTVCCAQ